MICRYCGQEPDNVVLVPESTKTADLNQSAFACLACAIKQGIFCERHKRAHQGFDRGGHACWLCIEETRQALMPYLEQAVSVSHKLVQMLPEELYELFFEEGLLALDPTFMREVTKAEILLEFLAREIAIHSLDVQEFIQKYLVKELETQDIQRLIIEAFALPPPSLGPED